MEHLTSFSLNPTSSEISPIGTQRAFRLSMLPRIPRREGLSGPGMDTQPARLCEAGGRDASVIAHLHRCCGCRSAQAHLRDECSEANRRVRRSFAFVILVDVARFSWVDRFASPPAMQESPRFPGTFLTQCAVKWWGVCKPVGRKCPHMYCGIFFPPQSFIQT